MTTMDVQMKPAQRATRGRTSGQATNGSVGAAAPSSIGEPALEAAAQRMNAGPHAASLAGLQALVAQRACADCEHVRRAMGGATPVQRAAKDTSGLPDGLRAGLENLSGRDLSGVSVHYDSPRPAQLDAHAFAQGSTIHVGPGQEKHLPHEGWHAVQQMQNRVRPTMDLGGTPVNDSAGLEREADRMGARAVRMGGAVQRAAVRGGEAVVQRHAARASSPVQLNGGKKPAKPDDSGKQDLIQHKMNMLVGMCRLGLDPQAAETEWESEMRGNGLCGGWVEVFNKYPEWTEELWAAMKDWEVPKHVTQADHPELLASLNELINSYSTRASGIMNVKGQEAFMQVIQLLKEAWQEMARLEPTAGYGQTLPDFTDDIATDRGEPAANRLVQERTIYENKSPDGAKGTALEIQKFARQKQKSHNQVEFVANIETDAHHMAVRVKTTARKLAITVVETENLGIETLDSWDGLARYLAGGFFFDDGGPKTEEVEIRFYAPE